MNKYIDAEKLKKLIDEKWKELANKNVKVGGGKWDIEISTYLSVLRLIESLEEEQPEVDLEKEIVRYTKESLLLPITHKITPMDIMESDWVKCAHHFYELGLKARKEK